MYIYKTQWELYSISDLICMWHIMECKLYKASEHKQNGFETCFPSRQNIGHNRIYKDRSIMSDWAKICLYIFDKGLNRENVFSQCHITRFLWESIDKHG